MLISSSYTVSRALLHLFTSIKYKALYVLHKICVPLLAEITLLQIPIFVNNSNHHSELQDHVFSGFFASPCKMVWLPFCFIVERC